MVILKRLLGLVSRVSGVSGVYWMV